MTAWDQIIGHQWAVEVFRSALIHDHVGHAYLLTGPNQVGKTTLAQTFAQAINCLAPALEERPCGRCRACTLIAVDRHPDVRLISGEVSGRGKLSLKIDQIRELQHDLNLTAAEGRYKVAILTQFEAANPSAANAFLKTLEEPPSRVILLLTAADAEILLPTIASRCRIVALRPLPVDVVARALQTRWQVNVDLAQLLAHLSGGRIGWAIETANDPAILTLRQSQLDMLYAALEENVVGRFLLADKLVRNQEELPALLRCWLSWWRDALLLATNIAATDGATTNIDQVECLQRSAARWSFGQILQSLNVTETALWQLDHNANARLVVENLLLTYPGPPDVRSRA